ncbi:MAG: hypothetical protein K8T91_06620 [Planctomycetes bacterium]|nr:hypothetical protein [Planctomycetota bacterium]
MELDILGITLRWFHIFAAMALVGGALFQRLALIGPSSQLPEDVRQRLSDDIRRRWSKVVMLAILVLLVSGLINYILTIRPYTNNVDIFQSKYPTLKLPMTYHALFGVKFLIGLVIFFIASALSGRGRATAGIRNKGVGWLSFNLVLAVVLVAISGVMRSLHTGPNVNKVLKVLSTQSDAPPAPAPGGPAPAGTQPAAAGTAPASELPPLDLNIPDGGIPSGK